MAVKADDPIAGAKIWWRNRALPIPQSNPAMYSAPKAFVDEDLARSSTGSR
jgi:hypothetical protein